MSSTEASNETFTETTSTIEGASADTLVIVSKVKKFIKDNSGFSTSKDTIDILTAMVAKELNKGIESARNAGRKTVMARDFQ